MDASKKIMLVIAAVGVVVIYRSVSHAPEAPSGSSLGPATNVPLPPPKPSPSNPSATQHTDAPVSDDYFPNDGPLRSAPSDIPQANSFSAGLRMKADHDGSWGTGCKDGNLELNAYELVFTCPSNNSKSFTVNRKDALIDKNGIKVGRKNYHFDLSGCPHDPKICREQTEAMFERWLNRADSLTLVPVSN
jgi:hypothetical protein